jgi:hypothetical protein
LQQVSFWEGAEKRRRPAPPNAVHSSAASRCAHGCVWWSVIDASCKLTRGRPRRERRGNVITCTRWPKEGVGGWGFVVGHGIRRFGGITKSRPWNGMIGWIKTPQMTLHVTALPPGLQREAFHKAGGYRAVTLQGRGMFSKGWWGPASYTRCSVPCRLFDLLIGHATVATMAFWLGREGCSFRGAIGMSVPPLQNCREWGRRSQVKSHPLASSGPWMRCCNEYRIEGEVLPWGMWDTFQQEMSCR